MLVAVNKIAESSLPASLTDVTGAYRSLRVQLAELDKLEREAATCENEIETFLEHYYARVLPFTARLERLRYRKTHGIFPPQHIVGDMHYTRSRYDHSPIARRKKELFRGLVKRCHPDNKQSGSIVDIADVYEAKTLQELWLLEIASTCEILLPEVVNTYLEQQQALMTGAGQEARHYIIGLQMTDLWSLKENVYEAALAGEDIIEAIIGRIENQIAALQQYFVKPRLSSEAA